MSINALNVTSPACARYWSELKGLSDKEKIELIDLLSSSLTNANEQPASHKTDWTAKFAGKWKDDQNERLDAALARFHGDWGGDKAPIEIAKELRQGPEMVRDVETWQRMLTHGKYLLDTCTCIAIIKKQPNVIKRLKEVGIDECKISDITLAELYFGAYKSGRSEHFEDVVEIMKLFEQYSISELKRYGEIRWQLESKGLKIGDMDMFIAATALEENLIVVTGNTDHFSRIEGVKFENWM